MSTMTNKRILIKGGGGGGLGKEKLGGAREEWG